MLSIIRNTSIPLSNNSESDGDNPFGDLVPLIWMIEKFRRIEGGCMMNELIGEVKKNFKGLNISSTKQ